MPGDPRKPCFLPEQKQVSTGQAGPEVNRDLEVLFAAVNQMARCMGRVSDFADSIAQGSFNGGSGNSGSQPPGPQPIALPEWPLTEISTSSNITLPTGMSGDVFIIPGANITVTLGSPQKGRRPLNVFHAGTANTITINSNLAVAICTLNTGQQTELRSWLNTSGEPLWNTGAPVVGSSGIVYLKNDLVFRDSAKGAVFKDTTDGNAVRTTVTADTLVTTDIVSEP